jgi:GNAT superfamily N-acetyltransferase
MKFELTDALIDDLLFAMEDQMGILFLDTREGVVVSENNVDWEDDEDNRFIDIPEWDSSEGYRVMERFAAGLKNPAVRKKLSAALDRGKGVFRAYKDALEPHPEIEQLWYAYKEQEMKKAVLDWYNGLRTEWGLESIGAEPEETEDLVLEDFRFRAPAPSDEAAAAKLHRLCLEEAPPKGAVLPWSFPAQLSLAAETGNGDFAGYISAVIQEKTLSIIALEVRPEYRGLGIGEALLTRLLETEEARGTPEVLFDMPNTAEGFSRVLLRESFIPHMTRYSRSVVY